MTLFTCLPLVAALCSPSSAQVAPTPNPDHARLLGSLDPALAGHKRLVYDFWREVLEAGHFELAEKYLAESYIQHNPNVPTGRRGFIEYFSRTARPSPILPRVRAPLIAIVAEGDLVTLSFARERADPQDKTRRYATTWFDMFRVENGEIVEHWDPALKE